MIHQLINQLVVVAGELKSRKRLQKVVFFLREAGIPVGVDYTLHYYGPFSSDVASACDQLVSAGFLSEKQEPGGTGPQYCYTPTPRGEQLAKEFPAIPAPWVNFAKSLIAKPMPELELGSTILYFLRQGRSSAQALAEACEFKKVAASDQVVAKAQSLAESVFNNSSRSN